MTRRIAVITGSRAEFGLLEPVMRAIAQRPELDLQVVVAGSHLLRPAETWRDIDAAGFAINARIELQTTPAPTRADDAAALGRGVAAFADLFARLNPHWILVLGDRIEPFAAAAAGSISGLAVAHIHGGDRAEGISDESIRHAITKLAHLHFPATDQSAQRIVRMGEDPDRVHVAGSPAIDGLHAVEPMSDTNAHELTDPAAVFLMHPAGLDPDMERSLTASALNAASEAFPRRTILCLSPNHDPGRNILLDEIERAARAHAWPHLHHLPRPRFIALLKRIASRGGVILGNSSAALIEAAAIRLPAVDIGPRQAGREKPDNAVHAENRGEIRDAIRRARELDRSTLTHPYGDGHASARIAERLALTDPTGPGFLRKRCTY